MSDLGNISANIPNYNSKGLMNIYEKDAFEKNKLKENRINNYYDINKSNENNAINKQTELSTIDSSSSYFNESETLDKEISIKQTHGINNPMIKEETINLCNSLFYGNNLYDYTPRRIGNMYAFCYFEKEPLIVIGPDCKKLFFNFINI